MSGKLYRLNTRGYVSEVMEVLNNYIKHQQMEVAKGKDTEHTRTITALQENGRVLQEVTRVSATTLVHCLVKYTVHTFLAYAPAEMDEQTFSDVLFGEGFTVDEHTVFFINDILTIDEIDNLIIDLDMQVARFIERGTWNLIDIVDLDSSISIVVNEDLRIHEWKKMQGVLSAPGSTMDIDLTEMIAYMKARVNRHFKKVLANCNGSYRMVGVGEVIDFRPIVVNMLVDRYGFLRREGQVGSGLSEQEIIPLDAWNILTSAGLKTEHAARFIDTIVRPVVEGYAICHYINRLDDKTVYRISVNENNRLQVYAEDDFLDTSVNEDVRIKELVESYLRGDYLPSNERDEAQQWVEENMH